MAGRRLNLGIIRSLLVTTSSDYTSYFHDFGKKTVLDTFFLHYDYITGSRIKVAGNFLNNHHQEIVVFLFLEPIRFSHLPNIG